MNNSSSKKTKKGCPLSSVQSVACREKGGKWRQSVTIVKTVKFIAQYNIF